MEENMFGAPAETLENRKRQEYAKKIDREIEQLDARERTVQWANEVLALSKRMEDVPADVRKISVQFESIETLRMAAEDVLRLAAEAEANAAMQAKEAQRATRAAEYDERIRAFDSRAHDLAWAEEALSFCDIMAENGRDVADISNGIKDLPRIRKVAQHVIKEAELAKKKAEEAAASAARRAKEEEEARAKEAQRRHEKELQDLDARILSLSTAVRSNYWCREVENVAKRLDALEAGDVLRLQNLALLESMRAELGAVGEAVEINQAILALRGASRRNNAWAKDVLALEEKINDANREYIGELARWEEFRTEALRILRSPRINEFSACLSAMEGGDVRERIAEFERLDGEISSLDYSLSDYIENFVARWKSAGQLVEAEQQKIEAEARAQEIKSRFEELERCLSEIEGGHALEKISEFDTWERSLSSFPESPSAHIKSFDARWRTARELVRAAQRKKDEAKRREAEEAERRKREAEEAAYQERLREQAWSINREIGELEWATRNLDWCYRVENLKARAEGLPSSVLRLYMSKRKKLDEMCAECPAVRKKEVRKARARKVLHTVFVVFLYLLLAAAVAAVVLGAIFLEGARHWIIAGAIAVAYTVFWNWLRKEGVNYPIPYGIINAVLAVLCVVFLFISDVTRIYSVAFALAATASAVGLVVQCWRGRSFSWNIYSKSCEEEFKLGEGEWYIPILSLHLCGILFSVACGFLFTGIVGMVLFGLGVAITLIVVTVLQNICWLGDGNDGYAYYFAVVDWAFIVSSFLWSFVSFNLIIAGIIICIGVGVSTLIRSTIYYDDESVTTVKLLASGAIILILAFALLLVGY